MVIYELRNYDQVGYSDKDDYSSGIRWASILGNLVVEQKNKHRRACLLGENKGINEVLNGMVSGLLRTKEVVCHDSLAE